MNVVKYTSGTVKSILSPYSILTRKLIYGSLQETDKELYDLVYLEKRRQNEGFELIASENITSVSVLQCLGSVLTNKYSEGYPNKRYYGGNKIIDKIEELCINRVLNVFKLKNTEWSVNVQPYSGSSANFAVYNAILNPHDRIMGLGLSSGGHLTHGFYTDKKKISASSIYFESLPYMLDSDGLIDYKNLEYLATQYKPKLIICGYSAYTRDIDYKKFRQIADINNSFLLCDMAHISGFVAAGELNSPFEYCDIVTSTTHKTLRGPRAGIIICRKKFEKQINESVFPSLQGGPHEHKIAAIATQMKQIDTDKFREYIKQVKKNASVLADLLIKKGYNICGGGTDNHIILVDLNNKKITGSKIEYICELANISINKNSVSGDKSALSPGGIRLGTPTLTTRGMIEKDMIVVAECLDDLINIAIEAQKNCETLKLVEFKKKLESEKYKTKIEKIKKRVIEYSNCFLEIPSLY